MSVTGNCIFFIQNNLMMKKGFTRSNLGRLCSCPHNKICSSTLTSGLSQKSIRCRIVAAGTQPLIWSVIRLHWRPPTTPLGGHHADCLTTCTASSSLASVLLLSIRLQQWFAVCLKCCGMLWWSAVYKTPLKNVDGSCFVTVDPRRGDYERRSLMWMIIYVNFKIFYWFAGNYCAKTNGVSRHHRCLILNDGAGESWPAQGIRIIESHVVVAKRQVNRALFLAGAFSPFFAKGIISNLFKRTSEQPQELKTINLNV